MYFMERRRSRNMLMCMLRMKMKMRLELRKTDLQCTQYEETVVSRQENLKWRSDLDIWFFSFGFRATDWRTIGFKVLEIDCSTHISPRHPSARAKLEREGTGDSPCGLTNQLHANAAPKVNVKHTKTVCRKLYTVAL